ncbi:MAG: Smr/MutS family protein [Caldilineales bacterium]|nr:Smr/MutS family protein [Caldilineales bacterium]MDW8318149.1 Smr/MutS family protein [Anaerolineae bacterium]
MNAKSLHVLEFDKILRRLAEHTSFSAGRELALNTLPTTDLRLAQRWLAETAEARRLLGEASDLHLGGVFDVRPLLPQAERGIPLLPPDLLQLRSTLLRGRSVRSLLTRQESRYPNLADIAYRIEPLPQLAEQIGQVVNDRGEILDTASPKLARLRSEIRSVQSQVLDRLNRLVTNPRTAQYLQEPLVTQRQGRYVIPLKAEHKGRIPGLVHDQSASGATLFVEPFSVVELNNQWRQLQLDEEEEIRRILAELTELVADEAPYIRQTVEALAALDLILARARYADQLRAAQPELVEFKQTRDRLEKREKREKEAGRELLGGDGAGPEQDGTAPRLPAIHHPGSTLDLKRARHPLLNQDTVVPIDVYIDDDFYVLVITGPNTGGKTVTLKTVGLLALMAQSGMHIPADEGSRLSCFEGIYADIGDEQSIEQSLSTFSGHLTNIIAILAEADERSLVLLDELGAGTDPEEGSALARALLDHLVSRRITTLATTHYSELKLYAHNTPGVRNASVEFDLETLAPTYELSIGLPGRSNALAIARRLGLDPAIVAAAEAMVRPEALQADSLLQDIKATRQALEAERSRVEALRRQLQAQERELRYRLSKVEEARRQVLNEARQEAQAQIEALAAELQQLRRQIVSAAALGAGPGASTHQQMLAEAQRILAERAKAASPLPESVQQEEPPAEETPLAPGETVWIPSLQASAQVLKVDGDEAELQIGSFRMRLPVQRLERRGVGQAAPVGVARPRSLPQPSVVERSSSVAPPQVGMELDLRGSTVEEMLPRLQKYLDDAYLAMLPWVRIIHGKGTGVLRAAVRKELSKHPLVKSLREGEPGEGGDGVTVAYLVEQ